MIANEILNIALSVGIDAKIDIADGKVYFVRDFSCSEEDEPHDIAWSIYCNYQDILRVKGLQIDEYDADHDSLFGYIIPLKEK